MKNLKRFLFVFLGLPLAFCLFACGGGDDPCKAHADENNDGKCDKCGETVEEQKPSASNLTLIENGEAKFQIVYAAAPSKVLNAINTVKNTLSKAGVSVTSTIEKEDNVKDCEILIGNITTRADKYKTDGHDYGMEGYVIKIIDSKVIINAGSDDTLINAIEEFAEDILGIDNIDDSSTVVMSTEQQVEEIQDDYKITSLSVDGKNMKGYTIAVNKSNKYHMAAAKLLQSNLYERTGLWLEIVAEDKADKSIVIKSVAKNAVDGGFKVSASENKLLIECGYDNKIEDAVEEFISEKIVAQRGDVNLTGTVYTDDISVVYYKDFGAKGDGIVDDFFALKAAHDFANISGQTVKADSGKTYRIYNTVKNNSANTIVIKTNVEWGNAKFIIEDTNIGYYDNTGMASKPIFHIQSDYEDYRITDSEKLNKLAGIGEGTTKIDLGLGFPAMLTIYNNESKVYRRKGYSSEDGTNQHEVILIDKDGNIDESTPFMFDYTKVTSIVVHRTDVEPIKVSGGTVTTMASRVNIVQLGENNEKVIKEGYFLRGINISRPGTAVEGVKHYVEGEISINEQKQGILGPAYYGFFYATNTNDVLLKNCVLTGRRCYNKAGVGFSGTQGTYDFVAMCVNKIRLEGCIQSNFYLTINDDGTTSPAFDLTYDNGVPIVTPNDNDAVFSMSDNPASGRICWGIGETDFCKNTEYINSVLSRFDAHQGLLNGKAVGTTINFFAMVGKGDFLIEDCTWIAPASGAANNTMIYLRDDYGSPWEGTITIKDTVAVNHTDSAGKPSEFGIIFHKYSNWYFGYDCYFPNLIIDNLTFGNYDNGAKVNLIYNGCAVINQDIHLDTYNESPNENPVVPPEFITIINNANGYKYYVPNNNFFKETDFSACEEGSLVRN